MLTGTTKVEVLACSTEKEKEEKTLLKLCRGNK